MYCFDTGSDETRVDETVDDETGDDETRVNETRDYDTVDDETRVCDTGKMSIGRGS